MSLLALLAVGATTAPPPDPDPTPTGQQATITATVTPTGAAGFLFRRTAPTTYLSAEMNPGTSSVSIYRTTAGVRKVLIQGRTEAVQAGSTYTLRVDLDGPVVTLYLPSGARLASITEPQGVTSTDHAPLGSGVSGLTIGALQGPTINWPRFTNRHATEDVAIGLPGSWEDTDINNPNIVWDPVGSRWVMYYTGYSATKPTGDDGVQMAGIAYANSLHGPWTKEPLNPVIDDLSTGRWSQNGGMERLADGTWIIAANTLGGATTWFYTAPAPSGPWTKTSTTLSPGGDPWLRINQITGHLEHWSWVGPNHARVGVRRTSPDGGTTWSEPVQIVPTPPLYAQNNGEQVIFVPPGREGQELWVVADFFPLGSLAAGRGMLMGLSLDGGTSWFWHVLLTTDGSLGWDQAAAFDSCLTYDEPAKQLFLHHAGVATGYDTGTLNMGIQLGHAWAAWDHTAPAITYP